MTAVLAISCGLNLVDESARDLSNSSAVAKPSECTAVDAPDKENKQP